MSWSSGEKYSRLSDDSDARLLQSFGQLKPAPPPPQSTASARPHLQMKPSPCDTCFAFYNLFHSNVRHNERKDWFLCAIEVWNSSHPHHEKKLHICMFLFHKWTWRWVNNDIISCLGELPFEKQRPCTLHVPLEFGSEQWVLMRQWCHTSVCQRCMCVCVCVCVLVCVCPDSE